MTEKNTVGLTEKRAEQLRRLEEHGHFATLVDGYRFAVALALSMGVEPKELDGPARTIFNIGTLDRDGSIQYAVEKLVDCGQESVYRMVERLAEWGVEELTRMSEQGRIRIEDLLEEAESLQKDDSAQI